MRARALRALLVLACRARATREVLSYALAGACETFADCHELACAVYAFRMHYAGAWAQVHANTQWRAFVLREPAAIALVARGGGR